MTGLGRWLGSVFCCLLAACDGGSTWGSSTASQRAKTVAAKPSYLGELTKLDAAIERGLALSAQQKDDHLIPLEVVSLYQERARLTGNYDDYTRAESLLASLSKGLTPAPTQCMARARLHFTLHRIRQAATALDSCSSNIEPSEIASLRADIAVYSGRYREAETIYRNLVNQPGIASNFVRSALLKKWLGAPGEAAALLEAAEKRYHGNAPTMLAWLKLQRGLVALERGRLDEALAMYRLATDALDGWWLIDEHIAEVLLLNGKTAEAKALYESIVARTSNPEFMDALAAIARAEGDTETALNLRQKARAVYEARLIAFPEAAAGHALEHYLQHKADANTALALAQKNYQTRPYGEAAMALAKAWMRDSKPARASALIEMHLGLGWDTADAYWLLGVALETQKLSQRAGAAKAAALQRNPASERMYGFGP